MTSSPQLGHRLMRRDHQLQPRPPSRHQRLAVVGAAGAAGTKDGLIGRRGDRSGQPQAGRPGPAPDQGGLAPRRVIGQGHPRIVVTALKQVARWYSTDSRPIILIHATPSHPPPGSLPWQPTGLQPCCLACGLVSILAYGGGGVVGL
jgi:hypothetical protein